MNMWVILALFIHISATVMCQQNVQSTTTQSPVTDKYNRTSYEHLNESGRDYLPSNTFNESNPPLWCPKNYKLRSGMGRWFGWCFPDICVLVPYYQENVTKQIVPSDAKIEVNKTSSTAKVCVKKFSQEFRTCSKVLVSKSKFEILPNGTLRNEQDGRLHFLGDFFDNGNETVTICERSKSDAVPKAETPFNCALLNVTKDEFRIYPNRTLYIPKTNSRVEPFYYFLASDQSSVAACIRVSQRLDSCPGNLVIIKRKEFELRPNMDVYSPQSDYTFAFRDYYIAYDGSMVLYCPTVKLPARKETRYLYGTAAVVSAVCLLLALVIYQMFPSLNYHTKALLCLAFSLMVMYIMMAARLFSSGFSSTAVNLIVFALQYIFALSAFFWLSALSYDLWKVFSEMKGTIIPGESQKKKRAFFAKCLYAWGIPTLMCIIVLVISFYPEAQRSLHIVLQLELTPWISEWKAILMFLYGPILILLIVNLVFFILTIINIRRSSSGTDILNKKINRKLFRVYVKIFLVMGLTWFAEIISWFAESHTDEAVWYVSDLINCLQGVMIFVVYVCKKKTLKVIKGRLGLISPSSAAHTTSTDDKSRKTSTMSLQTIQIHQNGAS